MSVRVQKARSAPGFTLVELIVVLGLMAIIGTIIAASVSRGLRADAQARSRIEAFEDMQVAMERMSREIRAADPIVSGDDNEIEVRVRREDSCHVFTYTYDPALQQLTSSEERFESNCITPTGTSGPLILVQGLANDGDDGIFTYWDEDRGTDGVEPLETPLADASDAAYVELSFVHELTLEQRPVTVSTVVGLRNH